MFKSGVPVIGLVGGVASGKSLVADCFRRLGAGVIDADQLGHRVLAEPAVVAALTARWGCTVLAPDGTIDRTAVGKIVFGPPPDGPRELVWLEQEVHPRIGQLAQEEAARLAAEGKPLLVLDAPVMLKAGWNAFCDLIVYVDTPDQQRLQRALERGWSKEVFSAREAAQEPLAEKRRIADHSIDNSGPPEATLKQVEQFCQRLLK